jgi:hypothetical protein
VGVKVRGGQTLELKVRSKVSTRIDLSGGLGGRPEEWRKWSPADDVVDFPRDAWWTGVSKVVTKRRFSVAGGEIPMGGEPSAPGCDVEVTSVTVGSIDAWSFAFAAFGPPATRITALRASWWTLTQSGSAPKELVGGLGRSMGYPEWLAGRHTSAQAYEGVGR